MYVSAFLCIESLVSTLCYVHFQIAAAHSGIADIQDLLQYRNILQILLDSLNDHTHDSHGSYNEVRYKLIIDSSADDSLMRMLFKYKVLNREKTKIYVCSDFPTDSHLQV